jgi:hypothetical protein
MNYVNSTSVRVTTAVLALVAAVAASADTALHIKTINTFQFSPPSPDPAGLTYLSASNRLLVSDSEVNEMAIFSGVNLFNIDVNGALYDTTTTTAFSYEPTGITYNPDNGHVFITDDNNRRVYELDPGIDGRYGTPDDTVTSFGTAQFSSGDPEGVAYDPVDGVLFIADGINSTIYRVSPGINNFFDGVPPFGDDTVTQFDTSVFGLTDPEGIAVAPGLARELYIVGEPEDSVFHVSMDGAFVRTLDISAANPSAPGGLAFAPGSLNPEEYTLYIADRHVDNYNNPNENDGQIYEFSIPPPSNLPPAVNAGLDQFLTFPAVAVLGGTVTDDGLPASPGTTTTSWSQVSGQGAVTFADATAVDTTASFSMAGTYVLKLTADDGALTSSDEVVIRANPEGLVVIDSRVSASSDDAEEQQSGSVWLQNSDLELVQDDNTQTVGMRFTNLGIPQGANIQSAYIQFTADETDSGATSLMIRGQASDHAATFSSTKWGISSRSKVSASIPWTPSPWTIQYAAGPDEKTPDIAPVIQEIVGRPGWSPGNALVLIITGTGKRVAASYDGLAAGAPLLHVEYIDQSQVNTVPMVSAVHLAGVPEVGQMLTGTYTYSDSDGDPEGASLYRWLRNGNAIVGATGSSYALVAADIGALISFEVTPVAQTGASPGTSVASAGIGPVAEPNTVPVAIAGDDQTITVGQAVVLGGLANDDGLPNPPGALSTSWSQISGPSTASFDNANALNTTANLPVVGTYVLRLTVDDGELTAYDELTVTVELPSGCS